MSLEERPFTKSVLEPLSEHGTSRGIEVLVDERERDAIIPLAQMTNQDVAQVYVELCVGHAVNPSLVALQPSDSQWMADRRTQNESSSRGIGRSPRVPPALVPL